MTFFLLSFELNLFYFLILDLTAAVDIYTDWIDELDKLNANKRDRSSDESSDGNDDVAERKRSRPEMEVHKQEVVESDESEFS